MHVKGETLTSDVHWLMLEKDGMYQFLMRCMYQKDSKPGLVFCEIVVSRHERPYINDDK
jgi:hypothetical protein